MRCVVCVVVALVAAGCVTTAGPTYQPVPFQAPDRSPPPADLLETARTIIAAAEAGDLAALDPHIDDRYGKAPYGLYEEHRPKPPKAGVKVANITLSVDDEGIDDPYPRDLAAGLHDLRDELSRADWSRQAWTDVWCTYDDPEPEPSSYRALETRAKRLSFQVLPTRDRPVPVHAGPESSSPVIATLDARTAYLAQSPSMPQRQLVDPVQTVLLPTGRLGFVFPPLMLVSSLQDGPNGYCFGREGGGPWRIVSVAADPGG